LADLPTDALQVAFQKTLKECTYWPVKVADIRKHVTRAESNVTSLDAEYAWQQVFEIRRLYWNPDIPDDHSRRLALLPERTQQAARAAGIFRDFESIQDLHVWAKKRFVESFIASAELEQDQFLLPDGELKGLLAGFAATKALPASEGYDAMRERGLAYTAQLKISPSDVSSRCQADPPRPLAKPTQPTRSIEEQKRILRERGFEI